MIHARQRCARCSLFAAAFRPTEPSSGYVNVSGGCRSYWLKRVYATLRRFVSCAIVIVDPHPLPMSTGAAAAAGVQHPEKSAGGRAHKVVGRTAARQRWMALDRGLEFVQDPVRDALQPRVGVLDVGLFFGIGQQIELPHQRRDWRAAGLRGIHVVQLPVVPLTARNCALA
jgi:hypothetical protein